MTEAQPRCPQCQAPLARQERSGRGLFLKARGVVVRDGGIWVSCNGCGQEYDLMSLANVRVLLPQLDSQDDSG